MLKLLNIRTSYARLRIMNIDLVSQQQKYIESLEKSGKSFNTLKNYKTDLNIFNKFLLGKGRDLILQELTYTEVKEYENYLQEKYNSPNSIRRRVQALRMFFDFLIGQNQIDENPIKKMLVSPKVVDLPKPTPFHIIKKLIEKLSNEKENLSPHDSLLVQRNLIMSYLIYDGGLKVSDIERLRLEHIKFAKGFYRVLVAPDKRDPYTVTMSESFTSLFEQYLKFLEDRKQNDKVEFEELFFNANPFKILNGGLSARGIEVIFNELSKSISTKMTAKSLRQACIFKWLVQGVPEARIKEWMAVQPQYSLAPYKKLLKEYPQDYTYMEL